MTHEVTKVYGHENGWACVFRQHRASSHCRFLHGYALAFALTFECDELDYCNWVIDFGGLKRVKEILQNTFDHRTLVATDDPMLETIYAGMHKAGLANVLVVRATGCEAFAEFAAQLVGEWLKESGHGKRVKLKSVKVSEHPGNSATYYPT